MLAQTLDWSPLAQQQHVNPPIWPCMVFPFFFNPQGGYRPHKSSLGECSLWGATGKGWGTWSSRGSNLLPLAQRSKQVVFFTSAASTTDQTGNMLSFLAFHRNSYLNNGVLLPVPYQGAQFSNDARIVTSAAGDLVGQSDLISSCPTEHFTILEPLNPPISVSELH